MHREEPIHKRLAHNIKTHKKFTCVVGGVFVFTSLFYGLAFFIQKPVLFSFANSTCVRQLTFFPTIHKTVDSSKFAASFESSFTIGNTAILSMRTCFTPMVEPRGDSNTIVETSPFGGFFARKQFVLKINRSPVANVTNLDKPLAVTRPVELSLSKPDSIHAYTIETNNSRALCSHENMELHCDVPNLKLKQGKKYKVQLVRQFGDSQKYTLSTKTIKTLRALKVKNSTIKNNQTIYSDPRSFSIDVDKKLRTATAELVLLGKKQTKIATKTSVSGKRIRVMLEKGLKREKKYRLVLKNAEAEDGSTLVEQRVTNFSTSGGPKVIAVNIGKSGVDSSAAIILSFDQKIANKDIKKFISVSGGSTVVTSQSTSVTIALQNFPRCKDFTIKVASGMINKYGIKNGDFWTYSSRVRCYTVTTYGKSVGGRALQAYVFGQSGPVTMYVGALHGNEPSSAGLMKEWINELELHPERLNGKRVVVIPVINPDGIAANTRNNSHKVNLNRNFPTDNWTADINDTDGKHKNGGGKKPLSEPEAAALATITQQYHPRLLLSFHAVGSLVVGDTGSSSASKAAQYASMVSYRNTTGASSTFDYDITGSYEEWTYRNENIPSMVIELGSYTYYSIDHHRAALWAML